MRDQLIGLSFALLLTGLILTPLEFLILDSETFGGVAPYLFSSLILGAAGLYWFKYRNQQLDQQSSATPNNTTTEEPAS